MSTCNHDLSECETACADGMCPLCLAAENAALRARLAEAEQEYQDARVVREQLEARLAEAERELSEYAASHDHLYSELNISIAAFGDVSKRLAEAEREQDTLLAMIRHQQDVLRECLPYLNESMAGRRPGRSADDIRAAVKALTTDSTASQPPPVITFPEDMSTAERIGDPRIDGQPTVAPFETTGVKFYRMQRRGDPGNFADFDPHLWALIVVPADNGDVSRG